MNPGLNFALLCALGGACIVLSIMTLVRENSLLHIAGLATATVMFVMIASTYRVFVGYPRR